MSNTAPVENEHSSLASHVAMAAISFFTGNPQAKQHIFYAVLGCILGFGAHLCAHGGVRRLIEDVANPAGKFFSLGLAESARGNRRCTEANTAGDKRRLRVVRYGIFVHGNMRLAQRRFHGLAGQLVTNKIHQK